MTLRTAHGNGARSAIVRVETLPADELPEGLPAPTGSADPLTTGVARDANGRLADRQAAAALGRRGGLAKAAKVGKLRALECLGLHAVPEALAPYLDDADRFVAHEVARLAKSVGGGECPPNAAALVVSAGLAMAGSRAAYAQGDAALGAKLGAEVRSNLLGAHELAAREAKARPRDAMAELNARLGIA
jgi:hypothetical protein